MLVLTRKLNEGINVRFGNTLMRVVVVGINRNGQVRIGLEAPREVSILREELEGRVKKEKINP